MDKSRVDTKLTHAANYLDRLKEEQGVSLVTDILADLIDAARETAGLSSRQ